MKTDYNDESSRTRLFVVCPKEFTSDDLKAKFDQFGDLEYCNIIRDKQSGESKGFGYVKFSRASTAAVAMENCDKSLKAILAEPKSAKFAREAATAAMQRDQRGQIITDPGLQYGATSPTHTIGNEFLMGQAYETGVSNRLVVLVSSTVTQEQIVRLFDLMPGMEFCDLKLHQSGGEAYGIAYITFNSIPAAVYAKEKLNGFEYPPGSKLVVKFTEDPAPRFGPPSPTEPLYPFHSAPLSPVRSPVRSPMRSLSPVRPLNTRLRRNSIGTEFDGRVFFICNPQPPADHLLREIFARFGMLTDIWVVRGKNYGYAKFTTRVSAEAAITALHGMEVFGVKLKVMLADPPPEDGRSKRLCS